MQKEVLMLKPSPDPWILFWTRDRKLHSDSDGTETPQVQPQ